ncbi:hypothetical protein AUP68_06579 [Ilyonectria robusta]
MATILQFPLITSPASTFQLTATLPLTGGKHSSSWLPAREYLYVGAASLARCFLKDFIRLLAVPVRHQNPPIQPRYLHRHNLETTIVLLVAGDSLQEVRINRCAKRKADGEALASPP